MKKSLRLLGISLIMLITGASGLHAQEKQYIPACIGFYNLENFYDTIDQPNVSDEEFTPNGPKLYGTYIYQDKVHHLATVLSSEAKDISPDGLAMFGVAEIENETVLKDLVSQPEFKGRNYQIVHYDSPDDRGVDVAFIYNPKYFKVLASQPLNVPLKNDDGSPRHTRDVLWVYGLLDGEPIHVFVNHWPSRRGGEEASAPGRALAASISKAKADSIFATDPNAKVVIMGDLNDDPVNASCAKVIGAVGDAAKVKPAGFFNPWMKLFKSGIGTLAYNDSWNLFDQIMISYGWLNHDQKGFFYNKPVIFNKDYMCQHGGQYDGYPLRTFSGNSYLGGYSDHFPVYIVLLKEKK
jgi:Endonuclease/Exonuclease/phosphatase family